MNTNLVTIINQIIANNGDNGDGILADPARFKKVFGDLAKDESKPLRLAFERCIEAGAYNTLKTAPDAAERTNLKRLIAQQMRDEHGLDIALCAEALDVLEAVLFAEQQKEPPRCASCGKDLQEGWASCPFCGTAVAMKQQESPAIQENAEEVVKEPEQSAASSEETAQTPPPQHTPADTTPKPEVIAATENPVFAKIKANPAFIKIKANKKLRISVFGGAAAIIAVIAVIVGYNAHQERLAQEEWEERQEWTQKEYDRYFQSGLVNKSNGDYDSAIAAYTECIRLRPYYESAPYNNRGNCYAAKGDNDKALADYNQAIKLDPYDALPYNGRGLLYLYNHWDYDKAIADFNKALELDPNFKQARENLQIAKRWRGY